MEDCQHNDPKRLTFTLARYKFVAKMLAGYGHVLEVGCGDGFATRIVVQDVGALTAVDLPEPDGPHTTTTSPRATRVLQSISTGATPAPAAVDEA